MGKAYIVDAKSSTIVIRLLQAMKLILALTLMIKNLVYTLRNTKCSLVYTIFNFIDSEIISL